MTLYLPIRPVPPAPPDPPDEHDWSGDRCWCGDRHAGELWEDRAEAARRRAIADAERIARREGR